MFAPNGARVTVLATALSTALAIAALSLAACGRGDRARDAAATDSAATGASAAATRTDAAARPNVIAVTASDFTFDAPATASAGLTTFRLVNNGPSLHHIQLVKLDQGKTLADFLAALKAGGPPPRWASMAGGPNPPEVGSSTQATVMLEPGTYGMVCFVPTPDGVPHVMKGMSRTLTVIEAARPTGAEPAADVVMKLVDYDFQLSKPLVAGRNTVRIENDGTQPNEVAFVRLNAGKVPMDFAKWGMHQVGPAPGTVHGGVSGIMPGTHAFVTADLPAGEYALICFFPDGKDGKPHFEHGMAKRVTVS